jgi:hypothetical protein
MLLHDAKYNVKVNPPTRYIWMILCSCGRLGVNRLGDTMAKLRSMIGLRMGVVAV